MIPTESKEWRDAVMNAPDEHEVHTLFRRYFTESDKGRVSRQRVVGRRIVSNGRTLYEELERGQ